MTQLPVVMVVDDDEDYLDAVILLIRRLAKVSVRRAQDGAEAFDYLKASPDVDLVLCDYMMPEMDGLTLKEQLDLDPELPPIPFVMISGYGTPDLLDMAASRGIEEWYDKPVEAAVLKNILQKYT